MALREKLNHNPAVVISIVFLAMVVAGYVIFRQIKNTMAAGPSKTVFFSDDDGKTYFRDNIENLPPWDHNGRQAVRAYVYSCNGQEYVAYIEQFTPELKEVLRKAREEVSATGYPPKDMLKIQAATAAGTQVKKPGDEQWMPQNSPAAAAFLSANKCPDGTQPLRVLP